MGLYIVNDRTKGDSLGRLTYCSYLGSSTVDCAITDLDQSQINYFTVMPQLPCTHVENMIDSFILTSFGEEKKTINLATEQLTTIFSTVVRKALRKRKHYRCKKEIAKTGWFDKECQNLSYYQIRNTETLQTIKPEPHINKPL